MKKVICLLLCAVMLLVLCGCGFNNDERMTVVYNNGRCVIFRDNETGVHYLSRNAGFCVMVNADGTPYTGEG